MNANRRFSLTTILIPDYDQAIQYFVETLGFHLREDRRLSDEKRWVVVSPDKNDEHGILLAQASTSAQRERIGDQTGGRVAFFLTTDDFDSSYHELRERGVQFDEPPRRESYGVVAVFTDLFGNRWDLIEPRKADAAMQNARR